LSTVLAPQRIGISVVFDSFTITPPVPTTFDVDPRYTFAPSVAPAFVHFAPGRSYEYVQPARDFGA
jgi:hypothetical protein